MAAIGAVVTLFYAIFLFQGYTTFFRDSDSGWHIRIGEIILASGHLPHEEPFSFSRPHQPWLAWEWLSDVLTAAVHRGAGLGGVVFLYGLFIAAGVWLWFRLNWDVGGNFLVACAFASLMLSTCNIHWLARPHVISWIFFLAAVRFCETLHSPPGKAQLLAAAAGAALWANLHGSFFFAPLIPLIWAAGVWLRTLIWGSARGTEWPAYLQIAGIAAAATFLNPYGWQLHLHVARYLLDRDLLDRIGEFQSFNFHAAGALPITLALIVAIAGAVLSLLRGRVEHFLFSTLLVIAALRSARALPLVALVALPLANAAIAASLASANGLRPGVGRLIHTFLRYCDRLRALDSNHSGFVSVIAACLLFGLLLNTSGIASRTGFPADQFPVAAASTLAGLPADARIFAPDKFGGYLIYRFNGTRKVFFDGRSDFYGAGFLKDYARIVQVRPGWRRLFDRFRLDYALLPNDYSLVGVLKASGWTQVYNDATVTLLRSGGKDAPRSSGWESN